MEKQILYVDDEKDIRNIFKMGLEIEGYKVHTAKDGEEAIKMVREIPDLSLIFIDFSMPPGMNGLEALAQMRQENYDKPAVLVTAWGNREIKDRCLSLGCDYLPKPVNFKDIIAKAKHYTPLD